jgi:hypothetical protein
MKDVDLDEVEMGYSLMSEEHLPNDLVRFAQLAEDAGFTYGSDPKRHLEAIKIYLDAGFKKVSVHNIGPNQEDSLSFTRKK